MQVPETQYARAGTVRVAYQLFGSGPLAVVTSGGPASHLDVLWEEPRVRRWHERLASFARVAIFDRRGTGASDPADGPPTLEQYTEDLGAVMDACGFDRAHGHPIKSTGDGFLATFPTPGQAIRAAHAAIESAAAVDLRLRVGVHTGEVELLDGDVGGLAVHIAARIAALAPPGQTIVSRTVKDILIGSGLPLTSHGTHTLKGVPGRWTLYSIAEQTASR